MKLFFSFILCFGITYSYSQDTFIYTDSSEIFDGFVSIIDKTEETKNIFDYSNPFSLVSLLSKNHLYGINTLDSIFFKQKRRIDTTLIFSTKEFMRVDSSGVPIFQTDSISGKELVFLNPNTGLSEPKLVSPWIYYFDFQSLSRLVIYEDTVEHKQTGEKRLEIVKIGFAKKYLNENKYDVVFTLPYAFIRYIDAFKVLKKLEDSEVKNIIHDTNSFYYKLNFLNRGTEKSIPYLMKIDDTLIRSFNYENKRKYDYLNCLTYSLGIYDLKRSFINESFLKSGLYYFNEELYYPNNFIFTLYHNIDYEEIYLRNKCEYFQFIESTCGESVSKFIMDEEKIEHPLYDATMHDNGECQRKNSCISYIYNDTPNIYILFDFMYNDTLVLGKSNAYIESIYITKNLPDYTRELVTLQYDLYTKANGKGRYGINLDFDPYIDKYVIKNYTSTLPCFQELDKQLNMRKRMNVNKDSVVKKLSEEFNLYSHDNHPHNLLGILP